MSAQETAASTISREDEAWRYRCPESLEVSSARELYDLFRDVLREEQFPLIIDVSEVERVDACILQLLAALKQEAHIGSRVIEWRGMTSSFHYAASLLGLVKELQLPEPVGE